MIYDEIHKIIPLDDRFEVVINQVFDAEACFKHQMDMFANCFILSDLPNSYMDIVGNVEHKLPLKFTHAAYVAGSYVMSKVLRSIYRRDLGCTTPFNDVDIYFPRFSDVEEFVTINNLEKQFYTQLKKQQQDWLCAWLTLNDIKINLIWGVEFYNEEDLLHGFDIRACAMCYLPLRREVRAVQGAIGDVVSGRIVYQIGARSTTIHRLLKYINKGFVIDKYQRVILAELIKNDQYSSNIEIHTNYGV